MILNIIQGQLQKIWENQPCHIVKARINNCSIYHGSFHTLKGSGLLNDEVRGQYLNIY